MDSAAKIPLSHTLWSPHDTVKDAAEFLGIQLPDDAAKNLAMDVEYRIHEILETAIKFMRHLKRKLLTTGDIKYALKLLNIEPLYGYDQSQPLVFKEAISNSGGQTLYYIDENEIEFEKLINQELPKVPRQTTFTAHWLAIEGVQPMIPQNPLALEIKNLPPIARGAISSTLANDVIGLATGSSSANGDIKKDRSKKKAGENDVEIKPLVKHVLSKELKLYFDKVVEVLVLTDPEQEPLKEAAFSSLRSDPGLHQLVPYFIQFVAEQVTNQLRNIDILITMLEVISALNDNKTIFLAPYVHALMPCILTLLLAQRIGPTPPTDQSEEEETKSLKDQFAVREFASLLLEHVINSYGSSYTTLKPRVTRTLLKALLDPTKPVGTQYGALLGVKIFGAEVIKLVLVSNLKLWSKLIFETCSAVEQSLLKEEVIDVLQKVKIDVDNSGDEISAEIEKKLRDTIGPEIADAVLERPDAKAICRGIFFGEENL